MFVKTRLFSIIKLIDTCSYYDFGGFKKIFFQTNTMLFPRGILKNNISFMSLGLSPQGRDL